MYDIQLAQEILLQILTAAERIRRRAKEITSPDDFISDDDGIDKLDAICMMLIAIGESLKKLDQITGGELLKRYPDIDWTGAKGMRGIRGIRGTVYRINCNWLLSFVVVYTFSEELVPGSCCFLSK